MTPECQYFGKLWKQEKIKKCPSLFLTTSGLVYRSPESNWLLLLPSTTERGSFLDPDNKFAVSSITSNGQSGVSGLAKLEKSLKASLFLEAQAFSKKNLLRMQRNVLPWMAFVLIQVVRNGQATHTFRLK